MGRPPCLNVNFEHVTIPIKLPSIIFRPKPVDERPKWLDDPRGAYGRADALPDDFPRVDKFGSQKIG